MSRVVAFRCRQPYLLVPAELAPAWMADASVEFLGDVETGSFGASVATAIEIQMAARTVAMVSSEDFYFSRPNPPIAATPTERLTTPQQVA